MGSTLGSHKQQRTLGYLQPNMCGRPTTGVPRWSPRFGNWYWEWWSHYVHRNSGGRRGSHIHVPVFSRRAARESKGNNATEEACDHLWPDRGLESSHEHNGGMVLVSPSSFHDLDEFGIHQKTVIRYVGSIVIGCAKPLKSYDWYTGIGENDHCSGKYLPMACWMS